MKRHIRSPSYPVMSLERSIEYTRDAYQVIGASPSTREQVLGAMNYRGGSNGPGKALSDLRQFRLISRDRDGRVSISALAQRLIEPDSKAQYIEALKSASNMPEIFKTLNNHFGPVDDPHAKQITKEAIIARIRPLGFNPNAYERLVRAYVETRMFVAGLIERDEQTDRHFALMGTTETSEKTWISAPVGNATSVRIVVRGEIGKTEIENLLRILNVQKEILK